MAKKIGTTARIPDNLRRELLTIGKHLVGNLSFNQLVVAAVKEGVAVFKAKFPNAK